MSIYINTGGLDNLKWVAFNMGNGSIHGDRGITSVTRHSSGRHEIIFDGNYFKFELFKFKKSKSELKNISQLSTGSVLSNHKINNLLILN